MPVLRVVKIKVSAKKIVKKPFLVIPLTVKGGRFMVLISDVVKRLSTCSKRSPMFLCFEWTLDTDEHHDYHYVCHPAVEWLRNQAD